MTDNFSAQPANPAESSEPAIFRISTNPGQIRMASTATVPALVWCSQRWPRRW